MISTKLINRLDVAIEVFLRVAERDPRWGGVRAAPWWTGRICSHPAQGTADPSERANCTWLWRGKRNVRNSPARTEGRGMMAGEGAPGSRAGIPDTALPYSPWRNHGRSIKPQSVEGPMPTEGRYFLKELLPSKRLPLKQGKRVRRKEQQRGTVSDWPQSVNPKPLHWLEQG